MNISIVGGGTAGWMTALLVNKYINNCNITLIESEEIGILGAGEGTTPSFVTFLNEVDINVSDLIKNTSSTIKNGIKFTNWNNDNSYYYHNFLCQENLIKDSVYPYPYLHVQNDIKQDSIDFGALLNEKNKTPFMDINSESSLLYYGIHFNARKIAEYLKQISLSRGIFRIEGKVNEIITDNLDNITLLKLENGKEILTDFVFDCTGFKRLIIGNFFKSTWISHSDKLPADSALPFFIEIDNDKEIPPYTESIAMKYGWMWKIPLQDRYGCGYVYDSKFITEKDAIKEIEEYLGFEPLYPRSDKGSFKFKAGFYKEPWINNCMSVGLSSGFIEPLEATSIWTSYTFLKICLDKINNYTKNDIDSFNNFFVEWNNDISDFLYLHYMGLRNDTEFWQQFKNINKAPTNVKRWIEMWENKGLIYKYKDEIAFHDHNLFLVGYGIGKIKLEYINKYLINNNLDIYNIEYNMIRNNQKIMSELTINHLDYLKSITNNI